MLQAVFERMGYTEWDGVKGDTTVHSNGWDLTHRFGVPMFMGVRRFSSCVHVTFPFRALEHGNHGPVAIS